MKEVDCRGMACPQPVVTTKQALNQLVDDELVVIVDNPSSSENVERFARSQGCSVEVERKGQDFYVRIERVTKEDEQKKAQHEGKTRTVVVYINSDLLGVGDEATQQAGNAACSERDGRPKRQKRRRGK